MSGRGLSIAAVVIGVIAIIISGYTVATVPSQRNQPKARAFTITIADHGVVFENETTGAAEEIGEYHLFKPDSVTVYKGDTVSLTVINIDGHAHSLVLVDFARDTGRLPGTDDPTHPSEAARTKVLDPFVADKAGVFEYLCGVPFNGAMMNCAPDHEDMSGYLIVLEP